MLSDYTIIFIAKLLFSLLMLIITFLIDDIMSRKIFGENDKNNQKKLKKGR